MVILFRLPREIVLLIIEFFTEGDDQSVILINTCKTFLDLVLEARREKWSWIGWVPRFCPSIRGFSSSLELFLWAKDHGCPINIQSCRKVWWLCCDEVSKWIKENGFYSHPLIGLDSAEYYSPHVPFPTIRSEYGILRYIIHNVTIRFTRQLDGLREFTSHSGRVTGVIDQPAPRIRLIEKIRRPKQTYPKIKEREYPKKEYRVKQRRMTWRQ